MARDAKTVLGGVCGVLILALIYMCTKSAPAPVKVAAKPAAAPTPAQSVVGFATHQNFQPAQPYMPQYMQQPMHMGSMVAI
ncbi:hypothetical protein T484DRAFT_1916564 [Baffinella frigidus]|nr:hypothetical protein T484DRAFT_1916564 [Cryptophyta sp. CCMP2293]